MRVVAKLGRAIVCSPQRRPVVPVTEPLVSVTVPQFDQPYRTHLLGSQELYPVDTLSFRVEAWRWQRR